MISLIFRVVSTPSISGICQSTRIRLYGLRLAWRSFTIPIASSPDDAVSEEIPAFSSTSFACSRAIESSSTISTLISSGLISSSFEPDS